MHLKSPEYLEYLRYLTTLPDLLTYHLHDVPDLKVPT